MSPRSLKRASRSRGCESSERPSLCRDERRRRLFGGRGDPRRSWRGCRRGVDASGAGGFQRRRAALLRDRRGGGGGRPRRRWARETGFYPPFSGGVFAAETGAGRVTPCLGGG